MKRIAVVDNEKLKGTTDIKYIQGLCPINRAGEECIKIEGSKLYIDEVLCIGCGICVKAAPPEAIKIINLPEALDKDPIHRYGENTFALYSLPTPKFGQVLGVLGQNGIGKSTAIKVLAQEIKPNFGKKQEANYNELIDRFKGTEAQNFFEDIKDAKIKVAYKPQAVDLIPKSVKGTVHDLLHKTDEKNKLKEVCEKLEINHIMDNNIENLSGGELQRVAIAATILKEANLYIFDEPTSYLDIKQRWNVANYLRSMANEDTSIMLIEHDLIILDYMTDFIQLMYGSPAVFGLVSLPRHTRNAINVYLDGYMKEENIRFREKKIKFEEKAPIEAQAGQTLIEWKNIKKKLGKFSLSAPDGEIRKNEVIGVLGENGIGKTTFMKILAGVLEKDDGEINPKVKISYKPQYIDTNNDELVMNILADAMKHHENDIIHPLKIDTLYMKKVNELSGGELQRVAIALALSRECDLVLLDEPSAYLDVEQRLIISKLIRHIAETKGISVIVIDHDLLFLDYVSNRLMVFDGQPGINGEAKGPFMMEEGMNLLLKELNITLRRDEESKRPRINKIGSVKDREQKDKGHYYYS